jgi:hypothetical protein
VAGQQDMHGRRGPNEPQAVMQRLPLMRFLIPFVGQCLLKAGFHVWCRRPGDEKRLLEDECETPALPPVYEEADLGKITGVPTNTTLDWQLAKLSRRCTRHRPVFAHLLRDVVMAEGHLFRWNMVQPLAHSRLPKFATVPGTEVDHAVLASTELGNKFFGHWLLDDVPLESVARALGPVFGPERGAGQMTPHKIEYSKLFGSGVPLLENAFFRQLTVLDERPEGPAKAAQYKSMRAALSRTARTGGNSGVMILRRDSGQKRILANELQIADALAKRGFAVVDAMASSVAEIVDACWDAPIVVGVEGSHLAHGFLPMRPGGTILTLQPPFKFDLFWKDRCDCLGAQYAFLIGDGVEEGFSIDASRVDAMVDRILN